MQSATLRALADVGTDRDDAGNVRLYHSTSAAAAASILEEMRLLPKEPDDLGERLLLRAAAVTFTFPRHRVSARTCLTARWYSPSTWTRGCCQKRLYVRAGETQRAWKSN